MKAFLRDTVLPRIRQVSRAWNMHMASHEAMEVIYRDLFVRDLAKLGLEDIYYPVSSASNYSLMYLILRTYMELPATRILEVGAGQSTRLLDALNRKFKKAEIVTLDHDATWADMLSNDVKHKVIHTPLTSQTIGGQTVQFHDLSVLAKHKPFNMIIVDGPIGTPRYSRLGLLSLIQNHMDHTNFIAIMDDAERPGEMQTLALCRKWLTQEKIVADENEIKAAKHQRLFMAGTFFKAKYY